MAELRTSGVTCPSGLKRSQSESSCKSDEHLTRSDTSSAAIPRLYYLKNLAGVSLGVLCILSSYFSLFYLQSSLHSKEGLGTTALTIDYISQVVTSIFLPTFLMKTIGCKWALVVSGICYALFIAANLNASFATLLPAAVLMGTGFSIMRATMNTVVSDLSRGYARLTGKSEAAILSRFFSIFYAVITSASVWANIITAQILSPKEMYPDKNNSLSRGLCGAPYCNELLLEDLYTSLNGSHIAEVPQTKVVRLVAAGLAADGLGIILLVLLLSSYQPEKHKSSILSHLVATVRLLSNPNLLLLIVITFNTGIVFSFLTADFTKAFVTCSIGIHNVGLVITCYGIALSLGTLTIGFLSSFVPRIAIFLGATILNVADVLLMLFWTPNPEASFVFYVMAGIWGIAFSVWTSQLCAFYAHVFVGQEQEAFSNHRIFEGSGFAVGCAWSNYLCMSTKLYVILGSLLIGFAGYLVVERRMAKNVTNKQKAEP